MRGLLAPLTSSERSALIAIGFGPTRPLDARDLRRLLHLQLIEWDGWKWHLTALGRLRYHMLVHDRSSVSPEI